MDPEVARRMRSTKRYQRWRADIFRNEPLCRSCAEAGFTVGADEIDHIEPASRAPGKRCRDHGGGGSAAPDGWLETPTPMATGTARISSPEPFTWWSP